MAEIEKKLKSEVRKVMDQMSVGEEDLKLWISKSHVIESLVKIPGDASTRRYYRLKTSENSYILMRMDPFENEGEKLNFLVVQKLLKAARVDVPAVLDVDPKQGFILLEDLGDVTLLRKLQDVSNPDVERHLYEKVIDPLVNLQHEVNQSMTGRIFSHPIESFQLRFDHAKLMWEVEFTIDHFYRTYLEREMNEKDLKIIRSGFSKICQILSDQPTVFTHRDYHCRNVMVVKQTESREKEDERFVMIDFQDARMGPAQYDLASLLKDSYYQLDEAQIQRLLDYYIVRSEAVSGVKIDRTEFIKVFDLMSVQRNFKAIGSFASFMNRRNNSGYLKYIGNTFENIRRTLLKFPEYTQLREVLFHYYYF